MSLHTICTWFVIAFAALVSGCESVGSATQDAPAAPSQPMIRSGAGSLLQAGDCRQYIGSGDSRHPACRVRRDDCNVLDRRDKETESAGFADQALDLGVLARILSPVPLSSPRVAGSGWTPTCDQQQCEIPVLVTEVGAGYRCQALLPYYRYCVLPAPNAAMPQRLTFFLAKPGPNGPIRLTASDGFQFVSGAVTGPFGFRQSLVVGIDLHEDVSNERTAPLGQPYFREKGWSAGSRGTGRSPDGLSFVWEVTADTKRTAGRIGPIDDGVLSAAFVQRSSGPGMGTICRPRDPIIVNVAN